MPRFEYVEGTSAKFWEIEIEGCSVTTRWGRLGTAGQEKTKALASPAKAQAEYDGLIREKVGKGYKQAGEPSPSVSAVRPMSRQSTANPPLSKARPNDTAKGSASALPEELRRLIHPRRNANAWTGPAPDPRAAFDRLRAHHARHAAVWRRSKSLEDPWAAPLLEKALRKLEGPADDLPLPLDPQVEAVLLAVVSLSDSVKDSCLLRAVEYWAGTAGLPFAVEALAASQSIWLMIEQQGEKVWVSHQPWAIRPGPWIHLRGLLSAVPETEWRAARDVAARLRPAAWLRLRVALGYLFPDVSEWAAADAREALGSTELRLVARYLLPTVTEGELLEKIAGGLSSISDATGQLGQSLLGTVLSMLDGAGPAAVQILARLLDRRVIYALEDRAQVLEALLAFPSPEVADALASRLDASDALAAVQKLAQAHPRWVLSSLAAQESRGPAADVLLVRLIIRHPELVAELLLSLPEASRGAVEAVLARLSPLGFEAGPEDLPPVLAHPPWMEKKKPRKALPDFWEPRAFTRPRLRGGAALPLPAVEHLGTMLALARLDAPDAGIAQVKEACDPASLEAFAWDLFSSWLAMGGAAKEQWAFLALGHLGGDGTARRLTPRIRDWPGEGNAARAARGLDVLAAIGTEVALMLLHGLSQKTKSKALQDRARKKIEELAGQRGLTPEELADRLVPDLGLGADGSMVLDFGPRAFRVGFDEALKPFVRDAEGKRLTDLPKPGKSDDPELAARSQETWKTLKKDVRALASQQILRLELAMCGRRRWEPEVFRALLIEHPLLQHLVRRLVWGGYGEHGSLRGTFRVAEDGSFADVSDEPWHLPECVRVGLVHSLDLAGDLAARWGEVLSDYEILQPFRQLGREVYGMAPEERDALELRRVEGVLVPTVRLLGLQTSRGWRYGPVQDGPSIAWLAKPLPDRLHEARLWLEPGIVPGMVEEEPEQTLGTVTIQRAGTDDWNEQGVVAFGELDPVVFSELVRDLESLR